MITKWSAVLTVMCVGSVAITQISQQKLGVPSITQNPIRSIGAQPRGTQSRSAQPNDTENPKGALTPENSAIHSSSSRVVPMRNPSLPAYLQGSYHQLPLIKPDNLDAHPIILNNLRIGGVANSATDPSDQFVPAGSRSSLYIRNPVLLPVYSKVEALRDMDLARLPIFFGTEAKVIHASSPQVPNAPEGTTGLLSHMANEYSSIGYGVRENAELQPTILVFADNSPKRWENFVQIPSMFGQYGVIQWGASMRKSELDGAAERFILGSYTGLGSLIGGRLGALNYVNSITHVPNISNINQYTEAQLGINAPGVRYP